MARLFEACVEALWDVGEQQLHVLDIFIARKAHPAVRLVDVKCCLGSARVRVHTTAIVVLRGGRHRRTNNGSCNIAVRVDAVITRLNAAYGNGSSGADINLRLPRSLINSEVYESEIEFSLAFRARRALTNFMHTWIHGSTVRFSVAFLR